MPKSCVVERDLLVSTFSPTSREPPKEGPISIQACEPCWIAYFPVSPSQQGPQVGRKDQEGPTVVPERQVCQQLLRQRNPDHLQQTLRAVEFGVVFSPVVTEGN